ncbi:hypothetical protein MMC11_007762 [Xylographa trunciseda]|nr:hypothetical protein [Xylographa trunciseda]
MPLLQSTPMLEPTRIGSSQSRFATSTAKAPSATPTSTLRPVKRKSAVDRGIHISMQDEAEDEREEFNMPQSFVSSPDADLSASIHHTSSIKHSPTKQTNLYSPSLLSLPRVEAGNPELPSKPQNDLALVQDELDSVSLDLVQRDSLSTVKDPWLQNLHTKLDKLHYELSPGFRSPAPAHWKIIDENVPIWSQGPHKLSMASKTWKTQRPKPGRTRKSTSSLPDPARDATSHSPELNSWRIKLNRLRCRLGTPQLCSLNSKPNVAPILLDETDIDTAAWILRQPPDGIGPEPGAGQMTYLGGFGRARTLAEWQQGPAPTNRKRTSSAASLANPSPCKTLRRAAPMIKVRLKRDNGVWRPLGFTNQTSLDGTLASENSDISGSRRASVVGERREGKGRGR